MCQGSGLSGWSGGEDFSQEDILEIGTETMRIYGTIDRDTPEELSFSGVIMTVYGLCGGLFVCLVFLLCWVALSPLSDKHRFVGISFIDM